MIIQGVNSVEGAVRVPGDKSIAHRALILGTIATGKHVVEGMPHAADVRSTIACLRSLGAFVEEMPDGRTLVLARDFAVSGTLDAGNSGTTARLVSGLVAGLGLEATIDGDASLRRRPMDRVATPLEQMGATVTMADGGHLPMAIRGGGLSGIRYRLPVASAQVKSAILIAGLLADGETIVEEPLPTRDHTERLLSAMSAPIDVDGDDIRVRGGGDLHAVTVRVPGDISAAAFFVAAASCLPSSEVYLPSTGINPTRNGLLRVLHTMGASIELVSPESYLEEPVSDIVVKSSALAGVAVDPALVPAMIDELPILAVAATQAEGETVVTGATELRHKESDRIDAIVTNLAAMGADIEALEDGFVVRGPSPLAGAKVDSFGDHRIAMASAVAGLLAKGTTEITGSEAVDISYPNFFRDLQSVAR